MYPGHWAQVIYSPTMIIRRDGQDLLAITQPDHARLAGVFAEAWRDGAGPSLVAASHHHDDGWVDWEKAPTVDDQQAVVERVSAAFPDGAQDRLDGLTVDLGLESGGWWFNVRPSNTEPLLRLNLLAATPADVSERVAQVVEVIR